MRIVNLVLLTITNMIHLHSTPRYACFLVSLPYEALTLVTDANLRGSR